MIQGLNSTQKHSSASSRRNRPDSQCAERAHVAHLIVRRRRDLTTSYAGALILAHLTMLPALPRALGARGTASWQLPALFGQPRSGHANRAARASIQHHSMASDASGPRVAVVGAGLAGAVCASEICRLHETAQCTVFDMGTRGPGMPPPPRPPPGGTACHHRAHDQLLPQIEEFTRPLRACTSINVCRRAVTPMTSPPAGFHWRS